MSTSFLPLSEIRKTMVVDYLRRQGMSEESIEWKYFDARFNRDRERGYVWLRDDQVNGFIGLIPFTAACAEENHEMRWTCDWSVDDPQRSPGAGVMLLKRVIAAYDHLAVFGGNDITRSILPRLATRTIADAGLTLHLPLRLGAYLKRLERRMPRLEWLARSPFSKIPLRVMSETTRRPPVTTEQGVSEAAASLFGVPRSAGWHPHYDYEYVDWQVGRCPTLTSWTCYATAEGEPQAAAVLWRSSKSTDFWRISLWAKLGVQDYLWAVLRQAVKHIRDQKALSVSIIVSHLDIELIGFLRANGFLLFSGRDPLFLCAPKDGGQQIDELSSLSYMDTDSASLFD